MFQNGTDVARLDRAYPTPVTFLLGAPRYFWRQALVDAAAAVRAAFAGDGARRFASVLRLIWFAGYLRDAWFGRRDYPSPSWEMAEER
jgi:hypothetical protein